MPTPTSGSGSDGERPGVVIDNGSGFIKCGFAGDFEPRSLLPTSGLAEDRPLKDGIIQDWETMETYWDHAFTNLLGIHTEQCNIIAFPMSDVDDELLLSRSPEMVS